MAYNDDNWGVLGKIPADADFFKADITLDSIFDGESFTSGYSKLIGEQVFKVTEPSETPFTARLTGSPVQYGAGWVERLVKRLGTGSKTSGTAKAGMMKRIGAKTVTADDDLRFYDTEGKQFNYQTANIQGWCPVSLPSDLDLREMFMDGKFAQMNGFLVDNVKRAYDMALESQIQKFTVTMVPKTSVFETTDRGTDLFKHIRDEVAKFKSDDYAFNYMSAQDNKDYEHKSKDVIIFMDNIKYNAMMDDFATLPSPEQINQTLGAEVVRMNNTMLAPYASQSAMAQDGFTDFGEIKPAQMNLKNTAPDVLILDKRFVEYRPLASSYRVNITKNGAGDFTNEHLLYTGGLNAKPWANAEALYLTE